ncbi:MAG: winged helix-turn-helix transcriptional regulator [Armatimonadetes bacterium]|nr:winged helix-turn-helix transcriptional regulator [Armatimonadota bacterium]
MPKDNKEKKRIGEPEAQPWNPERFAADATAFKALGDPTRLAVMGFLLAWEKSPEATLAGGTEMQGATVGEIACALTGKSGKEPPALSHHLKELLHAGLVTMTRFGKNRCYRAEVGTISPLWGSLLCGESSGAGGDA